MFAGIFSGKSFFTLKSSLPVLVWLILFCFCVNFFEFHGIQISASSNLVYCPLQKNWVARNVSKPEKKYQPFGEICAADKRKFVLQTEFALKISRPLTEKIVFDYLAKGDIFFAEFNKLPDAPRNEFITQTELKTAIKSGSYEFIKPETANLTLPQTPRPPTFRTKSSFEIEVHRTLEQISRNINPRSPPIFS